LFTLSTALLLCLLGFAVGAFGTLVGAGGGFILTPVLLLLYPSSTPELITAISLLVVFFNASSGTAAYARQHRVDYRSGLIFAACTLPGSVAGVILAGKVSRPTFDVIMGVALVALAVWLLAGHKDAGEGTQGIGVPREITDREGNTYRYRARTRTGALLSIGVGFLSSFLGIGGGVYGTALLAYIPQLPLEWGGLALGASGWLVQRRRALTASEGIGVFVLIACVLLCAAALETVGVPHR